MHIMTISKFYQVTIHRSWIRVIRVACEFVGVNTLLETVKEEILFSEVIIAKLFHTGARFLEAQFLQRDSLILKSSSG